jgi:predicted Rossmann-fold nucleotide-binding protein
MGSASGPQTEDPIAIQKARQLGQEIGKRNYIFINGACPGLPHEAMLGAKEFNGFTMGISPAFSEYEHINEYLSPHGHDMIIYTGMGFMERDGTALCDERVVIRPIAGDLERIVIVHAQRIVRSDGDIRCLYT